MFGLMRPQKCCSNKNTDAYRYHRMHYCGTCKTLGQAYGQQARALLNFDTVFFGEILSQLSKEELSTWQDGYQAINRCFTMPDREQPVPLPLQYAAATNILLGEMKLDDRIKDLPGAKWKLVRKLFSKSFRKADQLFKKWRINTEYLWHLTKQQDRLEKQAKNDFTSLNDILNHYAEPTAQITGLIFQKGAEVVGQSAFKKEMYDLGYQFGRLAYCLDAFEDVEKDLHKNQFNPLALYFGAKKTLLENQFAQARHILLAGQEAVADHLKKLPFSEEVIEQYIARLFSNISLRIYQERIIPKTKVEYINDFRSTLSNALFQIKFNSANWVRQAHYYMVSLAVFIIPLAADYVGYSDRTVVYKKAAMLTAVLAAIGVGRHALAKRKKRKAERLARKTERKARKNTRKIRRLFKMLPLLFKKNNHCPEECFNACCQSCCEVLCESFCENNCGNPGEGETANKILPYIVLLLFILIVVMILVFVV